MGTGATLRTKLLGLSTSAGSRVYPQRLPQGATLPAIAYTRVSGSHAGAHDGYASLSHLRYQLDCYASSYAAAEALGKQVLDGMHAKRWAAVSFVANDLDGEEDPVAGIYRRIVDVLLWVAE